MVVVRIGRFILRRIFVKKNNAYIEGIVVASNGRAGSTVLYESLRRGYVERYLYCPSSNIERFLCSIVGAFVARLDDIYAASPIIMKTHDLRPAILNDRVKYIYLHGGPLEAVLSVEGVVNSMGESWFYEHQYHLCGRGDYEDRYRVDVLNYEGQLESWLGEKHSNLLVIGYEDLWERKKDIEKFVGFALEFPEKKPRRSKPTPPYINYELFNRLHKLRDSLIKSNKCLVDDFFEDQK